MTSVSNARAARPLRPRVRGLIVRHPLTAFAVLAYLISWSWWIPFVLAGETFTQGIGWPTQMPGLAGPMLAGALVTWVVDGVEGLRRLRGRVAAWRVGWWWLAVPITLGIGAIGILLSAQDISMAELTTYSGVSTTIGPLATIAYVFVLNGLGEEVGWRGFAVSRLLKTHSLITTSLIVAAMWIPWHLPTFFILESFEAFSLFELVGWVIGLTAGSILLTWMFRGSGGSVLLVAVWHTAFNFTSAATPASQGVVAAITSTLVMVVAVSIVVMERRSEATRGSVPGLAHPR